MPRIALRLSPADNVVTLLDFLQQERVTQDGLRLSSEIPFGHKAAVCAIREGEAIIKYGLPIGVATRGISAGEHVHVHNCR